MNENPTDDFPDEYMHQWLMLLRKQIGAGRVQHFDGSTYLAVPTGHRDEVIEIYPWPEEEWAVSVHPAPYTEASSRGFDLGHFESLAEVARTVRWLRSRLGPWTEGSYYTTDREKD